MVKFEMDVKAKPI